MRVAGRHGGGRSNNNTQHNKGNGHESQADTQSGNVESSRGFRNRVRAPVSKVECGGGNVQGGGGGRRGGAGAVGVAHIDRGQGEVHAQGRALRAARTAVVDGAGGA